MFDTVTTGASNDIEQATKVARAMITQYGMSDRFGLMGLADTQSQYLDGRAVLNCGDATATEIDHEVMKLLKVSYDEAKRLLGANREALDKIADFLIQRETITGKEFMKIFREIKGIKEPEEKKRIAEKNGALPAPAEDAVPTSAISTPAENEAPASAVSTPAENEAPTSAVHTPVEIAAPPITADIPADGDEPVIQSPEQDTVIRTASGSSAEEEEKK